jgi:hypothetical protein
MVHLKRLLVRLVPKLLMAHLKDLVHRKDLKHQMVRKHLKVLKLQKDLSSLLVLWVHTNQWGRRSIDQKN